MRWLLTIAFVAVAVLSVLQSAEADKHRAVAASKDDGGRRPDSDKDQNSDRSQEKCREKTPDSEKKRKEELEREDERSMESQYGQPLRASAMEGLDASSTSQHAPSAATTAFHTELFGPWSGAIFVLRSLWRHFSLKQQTAAAATLHPLH